MASVKSNNLAKEYIGKKLAEIFGSDYVGENDKKHYVYGKGEGGEPVLIALSMTCPKVSPFATGGVVTSMDWSDEAPIQGHRTETMPAVEISEEEKQTIADMMARLGL